ncbi:TRAP transporter small permease, partial [Burkholderia latens]
MTRRTSLNGAAAVGSPDAAAADGAAPCRPR